MNMNIAIILAAGRGNRFGAEVPKQFVEVLGKPILAHTLETFQRSPDIDGIQVVCQREHRDRVIGIVRDCGIDKLRWMAEGGDTRSGSFRNAILALKDSLKDGDIVVAHPGVSPLVTHEDIAAVIAMCSEKGCCFTVHPVRACMARSGGKGWIDRDVPRETHVELNGPWAFRYGDLFDMYRRLDGEGHSFSEADSALGLWLADGRRAWVIPGSDASRMKITTPFDRDLFEGWLLSQQRRGDHA